MVDVEPDDPSAATFRILLIEGYKNVIEQLTPLGPVFHRLAAAEAYYDEHELWRGAYGARHDNREYRIVEVRAGERGRIYFADRQYPWQTGTPVTRDRHPKGQSLRIWMQEDELHWEPLDPKIWN